MRHAPTLLRRELAAYFLSPMAYLILLGFQLIAMLDFWELVSVLSDPRQLNEYSSLSDPLNTYVAGNTLFWWAVVVAVPCLTMRLLAEERRSGTIEALLTAPVTEAELVVSKWLGGVVMYLALLAPFAVYLPFLRAIGGYAFDPGPLLAMGLGLSTLGMMFVAIGLFFSALTRHQIVAAVATFAALAGLILASWMLYRAAAAQRSPWAGAIAFVTVVAQAQEFGYGRLDLRFLAIHASVALLMLYLTAKVVAYRRGS